MDVRVWGDEFYSRYETEDGYTVVRDPSTGFLCYAVRASDGGDLVSSGRPVEPRTVGSRMLRGVQSLFGLEAAPVAAPKRLLPSAESMRGRTAVDRRTLVRERARTRMPPTAKCITSEPTPFTGPINGLLVLVQFPDVPGSLEPETIARFANELGFSEFEISGSVRDYFRDVSGGAFDYVNHVTDWIEVANPRGHYEALGMPEGAHALLREALTLLESSGFDFSTLTTDEHGCIRAVNLMSAGKEGEDGLYPHSHWLGPEFAADGVAASWYQVSNEQPLSLGTFVHENGHMLFGWDDLYDDDKKPPDSAGTGWYDIMSYTEDLSPIPPNPWFRHLAGWETVTDLRGVPPGTVLTHEANTPSSFLYANPHNSAEAFYVEARRQDGRSRDFPYEGLVIWHIDADGSNDDQQMTPELHYQVSVEQADGAFDLEKNRNCGKANDRFSDDNSSSFGDATSPDAHWWDGQPSGLSIVDIGRAGPLMQFRLGP